MRGHKPWRTDKMSQQASVCKSMAWITLEGENMKTIPVAALVLASAELASTAMAQTESARLVSPVDGATLDAASTVQVTYEVVPGPKVDHIHLYVDGKETAVLRETRGTHALTTLPAGPHVLCIKAVTKAHVPTGLEQCNKVTVR